MDNAGFESARWDHWLLVACFLAIATSGLWLSWQWTQAERQQRKKSRLARRLAMEVHPLESRSHSGRYSSGYSSQRSLASAQSHSRQGGSHRQ